MAADQVTDSPGEGWMRNPGRCPGYLKGTEKRVNVILRNGLRPAESWPADGRGHLNWKLSPDNSPSRGFDVVRWKEAK